VLRPWVLAHVRLRLTVRHRAARAWLSYARCVDALLSVLIDIVGNAVCAYFEIWWAMRKDGR
jgi:hypothetical protein